jgi:hypothetical protein
MGDEVKQSAGQIIFWPIAAITIGLTIGFGYMLSRTNREEIMASWDKRRCDVPIMMSARYFKPPADPRTPSQFSTDNFKFCTDRLVKSAIALAMTPVNAIFEKQIDGANSITHGLNKIRLMVATMHDAFMKYMESFFAKYAAVSHSINRITQHFRSAFRRITTVMLSMLYTGLTMIKGMMNTMDLMVRIVVILLGIIVALLILLFFILFPLIPFFLSLIAAISAVAVGTTAGTLNSYREAFCFAPGTMIALADGGQCPIETLGLGTKLAAGAEVETIIRLDGSQTQLKSLRGILVSGSHLVLSESGNWHSVDEDSRVEPSGTISPVLYCMNTTTRIIPVITPSGFTIQFRDWEEISDSDISGQHGWNRMVMEMLNGSAAAAAALECETALFAADVTVLSGGKKKGINDIEIGDLVDDISGTATCVLGIVEGSGQGGAYTEIITYNEGTHIWERINSTVSGQMRGRTLITDSGTFYVVLPGSDITLLVRDFTEVGHRSIDKTYSYVASRLRLSSPI